MEKIIQFSDYVDKSIFSDILEVLKMNNNIDALTLANEILKRCNDFYNINSAVPIVKISKNFGISVYKETLDETGYIKIDEDLRKIYNNDKIIVASEKNSLFANRYITAYQLGMYLMDYIINNDKYEAGYYKISNNQVIDNSKYYNFAQEVLMPEKAFLIQYKIALKELGYALAILSYLSRFFEVPPKLVEQRIKKLKI